MAKEYGQVELEIAGDGIDGLRFGTVNKIAPTRTTTYEKEAPATIPLTTITGRRRCGALFFLLFSFHLLVAFVLTTYLTIRGLLDASRHHKFHPIHWHPPLLTSTACSMIFAFSWLAAVRHHAERTLTAAFWLSPLLTFLAGILALSIGTGGGLTAAAFSIIFALIQSLYACWVRRRYTYGARILSISLSAAARISMDLTKYVGLALVAALIYSCFWVSGLGGIVSSGTDFPTTIFLVALLISIAWTMHTLKNVLHASIARVGYLYFVCGVEIEASSVFRYMGAGSIGNVCLGSALVPVIGLVRGVARTMTLVAGDTDEFMFSCVHCYSGVAERLMMYGNRWGFVHVGMFGKGFVQASADVWGAFMRASMEPLVDADLTGSFCFLCGVASGALCALVSGSWALVVEKSYATSVWIYAFLIGYFMSRIAMAWPQACVSAYYVAYADNPRSQRFDSTIPDRIRRLQQS